MPPEIFAPGQLRLQGARGLDERHGVPVVFLDPSADRQDGRVEHDVERIEARALDEQPVRALEHGDLARGGVGLALLVERHHHGGGAVAADGRGPAEELLLAFLEADRVDDRLALDALQAGFEDGPARAVDHDRQPRDLGLGGDQVEEPRHRLLGVEHPLVHVDVEDVGAAPHLLERHVGGLRKVAGLDQALGTARSR